MHYIIYKTTNKLNGMYYIGCHQTNNLNDGYLGSGKHLKRAIQKYGKENFVFEILYFLDSKKEMFQMEKIIVNETLVNDSISYNLKIGGNGGNPGVVGAFRGKTHTVKTIEKIRNAALKQQTSENKRKKLSENNWSKKDPILQKIHASKINKGIPKSKEHKEKLKQANLGVKHKLIFCPHCGIEGGDRAIKRWHLDNCKHINSEALK